MTCLWEMLSGGRPATAPSEVPQVDVMPERSESSHPYFGLQPNAFSYVYLGKNVFSALAYTSQPCFC
jgi:hypothetical protein